MYYVPLQHVSALPLLFLMVYWKTGILENWYGVCWSESILTFLEKQPSKELVYNSLI